MQMKIKILISVLVLLILVNLAAIGSWVYFRWTESDEGYPPQFRPRMRPPFAGSESHFNEDQREKLGKLLQELREEAKVPRQKTKELEDRIFGELQTPTPDDRKVDSLMQALAESQKIVSRLAFKKLEQAKSFLDTDQQRRFFYLLMHARPNMPGGRRGVRVTEPDFPPPPQD